MTQLTLSIFPKPDTSLITVDRVFEKIEEPSHTMTGTLEEFIRLAKDLAEQRGPLMFDHHDHVRSILGSNLSDDMIDSVEPIDDTPRRTVISRVSYHNGRYLITTKKVRRL